MVKMHFFWNLKILITITVVYSTKLQECVGIETDQDLKTISSATQFFQDNCICETNSTCQCCIKYDNNFFKVHQKLCGNLTVDTKDFMMISKVIFNNAVIFNNTFSGSDIPPYCIPVMTVPPILGCLKAHTLKKHDNNQFHVCSNATLSVIGFKVINFQIGCIDFGTEGIKLVDPDHANNGSTEAPPEVSLETSDTITEVTATARNKFLYEGVNNKIQGKGSEDFLF